jgi:hypothetical protein
VAIFHQELSPCHLNTQTLSNTEICSVSIVIQLLHQPCTENSLYCWNVFTKQLHSNGRSMDCIESQLHDSYHCCGVMSLCLHRSLFTEPLPRSRLHNLTVSLLPVCIVLYLLVRDPATLWPSMLQYYGVSG